MSQWYYQQSGQQRGPVGENEIQSLLENQRLQPDTLVWREGMPEWRAADTLANFQALPYAPPSTDPGTGVNWSGYTPSGPQIRPWVRYWARSCDFLLFCTIGGAAIEFIWPPILEMNDTLLGILMLVVYNFIEPLLLATIGTTPFKGLMGVRVRNADSSKLSYLRALHRMFSLWIRGQGLGVPLISFFTSISSYKRLTEKGATSWDQDGGFTVTHRTVGWWRWLILSGLLVGFCALIVLGYES